MRKPRVAIVYDVLYPWVQGGAEKRFWEIARRLPAHGFEPHLVGPQYWEGPSVITREGVWMHGVCAPRELYSAAGTRTIGEALSYARDLLPALLRMNFELIDCCAFPYFPWFSARAVAGLRRTPMLTTWPEFWGPYWLEYLGPARGRVAQIVELATLHFGGPHLCLSPFTERRLRAAGARRQITPVPAGIDRGMLQGYVEPWGQRSGAIFVGRLLAHKRVADLLRAWALLREYGTECTLQIVGQGPEEAGLRMLADALGLNGSVHFQANLAEEVLYAAIGKTRCLVLPSEREGQGIVVAEAQCLGTIPIVARGPETAAPDFVEHGRSGLTYQVGDVEALAALIRTVLSDSSQAEHIAGGARDAAVLLDWDAVIVPAVGGLYRKLLGDRRQAGDRAQVIVAGQ